MMTARLAFVREIERMSQSMGKFKDDEGRSLDVRPTVLLVGPGLEDTARALLTSDRLEDGKVNLYKGTAELVVSTRITINCAHLPCHEQEAGGR